ncbi:MAG: STAS domain-containing protein [Acidimicrobiia bacterium]
MTLTELARHARPAGGPVMSIAVEDSTTVVALRGVGDLATLPAFVDTLASVIADRDGSVVVDLLRTEYLDTNRVRVIGRTAQFLDDRGRTLTIRSASRQAVMVLSAFGLSHLVDTGETLNQHPRTDRLDRELPDGASDHLR